MTWQGWPQPISWRSNSSEPQGEECTSTAPSTSALPLAAVPETPSRTAALISSAYLVRVNPSSSFKKVSGEVVSSADFKRLRSVVCFFKEESSGGLGPVDSRSMLGFLCTGVNDREIY